MITSHLAQILYEKNIKMTELSQETGISKDAISQLYHNKAHNIDIQTLDKLCNHLDISLTDLLEFEEHKDVPDTR